MQMFNLSRRPGTIGGTITNRTEKHGDEDKPALTLKIKGVLVTKTDLGVSYADESIHDHMYSHAKSKIIEPRFENTVFLIEAKYKNAKVTIKPKTLPEALVLQPATISDIRLYAQPGGHTLADFTVKAAEPEGIVVNTGAMLNQKCSISISGGKLAQLEADAGDAEDQTQLELEGGGPEPTPAAGSPEDDEGIAGGGQERESTIGRQIRSAEAKKKRASRKVH